MRACAKKSVCVFEQRPLQMHMQVNLNKAIARRGTHVTEILTSSFSALFCRQVGTFFSSSSFFSLAISPAKCLSLKLADNDGRNPAPLRFRFPLSSEDKM